MYGFCRLGLRPSPSGGAAAVANGLETAVSEPGEREREPAEHGCHPEHEVGGAASVDPDRERRVRGQDEQPEQQRPFLPAPEGGQLVRRRQRPARVLRDVAEREVVAEEAGGEDDRGDERREERRDERVARRVGEPPPVRGGGVGAGEERVGGEAESDEQRGAAELRHRSLVRRSRTPCTSTGTS